jgi:DNA-binding transcriptional LysR family regulator
MDFRLRVFVEVASHLSFTKAANVLEISQPAITKHIQELEGHFGVKLFERAGGKISLTSSGRMLLHHADAILLKYKELADDMALVAAFLGDGNLQQMPRILKIGATPSSLKGTVVPLIEEFSSVNPGVKIELEVASETEIEEGFRAGNFQFAFVGSKFLHRKSEK